jgi:apolipoprotein N-acyltransferase
VNRITARAWGLAGASGGLQVLLFLSADFSPLSWIALAPLLVALMLPSGSGDAPKGRQGFFLGYFSGVVFYLGSCYWIYHVVATYGGVSGAVAAGVLILFSLYLGLYHGLFALLLARIARAQGIGAGRALALAPVLWAATELARTLVTGVPLNLLGTAQVDNIPLTQVATVTGVYGVSFAMVVVNASFAAAFLLPPAGRRAVLLASLSGAAALQAGMLADPPASPSSHTAVLLQHNISLTEGRWTAELFDQTLRDISAVSAQAAARSAARGNPQLIAWPESPAPFYESDPSFRRYLTALALETGAYVLAGDIALQPSPRPDRRHQALNSASMVAPDGSWVARYDKIHLVPFGEYVPFEKLLFFAGTITREVGDFGRGSQRTLLPLGEHRVGLFICYESVFPGEVREFAAAGGDLLMNISNDTWLDGTRGPEQHLSMARMRAIENRRWLLRPTNSGITASIDPYGRVVARAQRGVRTALEAPYAFISETTFYTRYGDVFAWTCAIISLAALLLTWRRRQV